MAATDSSAALPASLADAPRAGQTVQHEGKQYTTVKEGLAYILTPPNASVSTDPKKAAKHDGDEEKQSVFYNPIQQFNRDLSVLAIRAFGEDALASKQKKREQNEKRLKKRKDRIGAKRKELAEQNGGSETGNGNKRQRTDEGAETSHTETTTDAMNTLPDINAGSSGQDSTTFDDSVLKDQDLLAIEDHAKQALGEPRQEQQNSSTKGLKFRILDALSATGLRALRYAHEIPFATSVTGNDLSPAAVESMRLNIAHNKLEHKITPVTGNAMAYMYQLAGQEGLGPKYDVIDLDPYGTAVPFLDAAVQAVSDGGLLCVTCTDAGVFAATGYLEKTYSQYGGLPIKGPHSHEGGLRLILHAIATTAARYGLSIEPLLSLSIDFYARVFVRVRKSPAEVKFLAGKTMLVYSCDSGCGAWTTQFLARNTEQEDKKGGIWYKHSFAQGPSAPPHCQHCGFKTHLSGPMYGGPLHNPAFIEKILSFLPTLDKSTYATINRIEGMLRTAHDETLFPSASAPYVPSSISDDTDMIPRMNPITIDPHPFFFYPSHLAKILHCHAPSDAAVKGALRHAGYRTTRTHTKPGMIKTDASWAVIWEIMREWVRQKAPIKDDATREGTPGWGIWAKRRKEFPDKQGESKDKKEDEAKEANESGGDEAEKLQDKKAAPEDEQMKVVFDEKLGKDRDDKKLVRYQQNPRVNWGPMARAK